MSNCSQIPIWVPYLQALAVPILALIIAAFGAWIAARQMLIAHDKLQRDAFEKLYDRRVVVYEATRKYLADVFIGNISENEIRAYGLKTLDAQFLFDDSLHNYLKEVRFRVTAWSHAKLSVEKETSSNEKDEYKKIMSDHLNWIIQQGDERTGFATGFIPFLKYNTAKRPWFLRWPS